jgi:hypothetical protein
LSPTGPTLSAMAVELQVGLVREVVRVTATAVWSQGWWTIRLVGAPEINAQVRHLAQVHAAIGAALAPALGRDDVDARVHIRWYDAADSTS